MPAAEFLCIHWSKDWYKVVIYAQQGMIVRQSNGRKLDGLGFTHQNKQI